MASRKTKEIVGLRELTEQGLRVVGKAKDSVETAIARGALLVAAEAQRNVTGGGNSRTMLNVRTGRLRAAIGIKRISAFHYEVIVNKVVYAAIHEFGGMAGRGRQVHIPARPYLTPAFESKREQVFKSIRESYFGPLFEISVGVS